ncbi:MAG: D-hexose-6-phosphate mutarotase [Candidatus Promineifilaceae bacterium]
MSIDLLNTRFAIPSHLTFVNGKGGLPLAVINNQFAMATVSLLGGQVLTYQPHGEHPVLWLSEGAYYRVGKANRGGVPISWPWFANHATDTKKPAHGFLRTARWEVSASAVTDAGGTSIALSIVDNEATRALWSHPFRVTVQITVTEQLEVLIEVHNSAEIPVTWSAALHSYFYVGDVEQIGISGLDGVRYEDKVAGGAVVQAGDVSFSAEVDRIYVDTTAVTTIHDPILKRQIHVGKSGSNTTVVWNPSTTAEKPDLAAGAYRRFVCVEAVKTGRDVAVVRPNESFSLGTTISTS